MIIKRGNQYAYKRGKKFEYKKTDVLLATFSVIGLLLKLVSLYDYFILKDYEILNESSMNLIRNIQ